MWLPRAPYDLSSPTERSNLSSLRSSLIFSVFCRCQRGRRMKRRRPFCCIGWKESALLFWRFRWFCFLADDSGHSWPLLRKFVKFPLYRSSLGDTTDATLAICFDLLDSIRILGHMIDSSYISHGSPEHDPFDLVQGKANMSLLRFFCDHMFTCHHDSWKIKS